MSDNQRTSMRRDQRVLRHSMQGAFYGWLSTYVVYLVLVTVQRISAVLSESPYWPYFSDWSLIYIVGVGVGSFLVTLAGWIFVGLPIAAAITDRQARSYKFMITIHALATVLVVAIPTLLSYLRSPIERSFGSLILGFLFSPLTVSAAAISVIGGVVFCA